MVIVNKIIEVLIQFGVMAALLGPVILFLKWKQRRATASYLAKLQEGPQPPLPLPVRLKRMDRALLLEPNTGSDVKVEAYALGMEFVLKLGVACKLQGTCSPDTYIRCSTFSVNAPCPNFARVLDFRTANVSTIGVGGPSSSSPSSEMEEGVVKATSGAIDLWHFRSPVPMLDMPTMAPANSFVFIGQYDGKIPDGYKEGDEYRLSVMLAGYASTTA